MYLRLIHEQQSNYGSNVYEVELDKPYTVQSFIEAILNNGRNEWGSIYFNGWTTKICEYSKDKITNVVLDNKFHSDEVVTSVTALGCWGNMDYHIKVEED